MIKQIVFIAKKFKSNLSYNEPHTSDHSELLSVIKILPYWLLSFLF